MGRTPALDAHLDIFGNQPPLHKLYTQVTLCYGLRDTSRDSDIVQQLSQSLEHLTISFPWIAGQVIKVDNGVPKIRPLDRSPHFVVKDYRSSASIPSFDKLKEASFPFSMLNESVIAPCPTLSHTVDGPVAVFLVQANFIDGGLLLTFNAAHDVMDLVGQGFLLSMLDKICNGASISEEEEFIGNPQRETMLSLLDESYQPGPEIDPQRITPVDIQVTPEGVASQNFQSPARSDWEYFIFSPSSLLDLKAHVSSTLPSGSFISTDDALTALVYARLTAARLYRLPPTSNIAIARAVDARRYLGLHDNYPGLMHHMTYHTFPAKELPSLPLGDIALDFRRAVDPATSDVAFRTRALATALDRAEAKSKFSFTACIDGSRDMMLSSWSKVDWYDLSFGLCLGKPEAVRRPYFQCNEGIIYFMPRRKDGEIAVGICARKEDLDSLRTDKEWARYGRWIG
ncbi:Isotrichodermin C-15 hydroxylase [Elsinoe australis]|uniref:Isotrichodermin C-15 hydroxylase n=1 Tax=Elsinoe australis TaxID=40998 RepID=A0A2P7ZE91_9PEZI|nr:Isotrichodermin C-15 hydroxylase [Elsinoe australis]